MRKTPIRPRRRGFSLIDVMVGLVVLSIGALGICPLMPVMRRSQVMSYESSRATQIAQREIEAIRQVGYANLNYGALLALGLVNDLAEDGKTFYFTKASAENSSKFSPAQALKEGTGEVVISEITATLKVVVVTVRWKSPTGVDRSIELSTMVGANA